MKRKLRAQIKDLEYVSFGFRIGYWPCLKAPYIQIVFAGWRCDFWYGLPSYRYGKKEKIRKELPMSLRQRQEIQKMLLRIQENNASFQRDHPPIDLGLR